MLVDFAGSETSFVVRFGQALGEGPDGRPSVQAVTLMGPSATVALQIIIQHGLHFHDGLDPGAAPPPHTDMLIEQRTMDAFKDAAGLRPPHASHAMGKILKLQENSWDY
jgi:hypothetical protein